MKRIINLLTIIAVSILLHSCNEQEHFEVPMNEDIVLDLTSSLTRAEAKEEESYVDHIDVFIFEDVNGTPTEKAHYERRQLNNARQLTLSAKRSSFRKDMKYRVYLIANSHIDETTFSDISQYNALLTMKQEDPLLYLTGLSIEDIPNPKYFLMDAVAKDANNNSAIVLNNGNVAIQTTLNATLRRAAAKVQVTIDAADNVEFKNFTTTDGSEGGVYYVRNLSYDAYLLAEAKADNAIEAKVRTTSKGSSRYFTWQPETNKKRVTLTVYAYPNHWSDESILEHETCIVVNLPMTHSDGTTTTNYPNSWYKIPMTNDQTLRRNNYYEVNITLNRPGAIFESTPVDVENIYYEVADWTHQNINVGGENKVSYLMVNHTEMEMYNTSIDATTLEFASSSPIRISVKDVYYYNKYGVKSAVTNADIYGTTNGGLGGNITVSSPTPTNNTIRYFTLEIVNQENIKREVTVKQYPLVYITNIQSYYSYRSDFLNNNGSSDGTATGNHYENRRDYSRFAVNYRNGSHSYSDGGNKSSGFFVSKVVSSTYTSEDYKGLSNVDYYTKNSIGNFNDPYNARMYHITITATSNEYILGRPKITNGVTDPGEDNARMVSPSFMIASRLGTLTVSEIGWGADLQKVYSEHAKQYVEVYKDPISGKTIHLSDWRLPTEAELEIIYKFQGTQNDPANADAIDYLLNAKNYYSASGPVPNPKSSTTGTSVRCIRDVYETIE